MSQLFKNIGLKFFKKQQNVEEPSNEGEELEPNIESEYHIEFINYQKIGLFRLWFLKKFCMHDWKIYNRTNVMGDGDIPVRIDHTFICRKCGDFKKITL